MLGRTSGLLGHELDKLWGRRVGDVQVVGKSLPQSDGNWHALFLHPALLGVRDTSRFHIDWFIWVNLRVEDTDELVYQFVAVLRIDGNVVSRFIVHLVVVVDLQHN